MTEEKEVHIHEFAMHEIPDSCTWIIVGPPSAGKTALIEDICYVNKHRYPVARAWCATEDTQGKYSKFIKPLYITNDYKSDEHQKGVLRQKSCIQDATCKNANGIYIIDDCNTDKRMFATPLMKGQFKNGTRWWKNLFILGSHYVFDAGPDIRKCPTYVAVGKETSVDERKKLHGTFAIACTFPEFCQLMDELTEDHTFIIFKKQSDSNHIEDCVFYYRAKLHGKWNLGCRQYQKWGDDRYNKSYVDANIAG